MAEKEIWKDIKGYEGLYQVSNFGRVKSVKRKCKSIHGHRTVPEKIYSISLDSYGYPIVSLHKDGKKKTRTVHRIVAEAFIENPLNLPQINHKDENKTNNCADNLEWCDNKYNLNYGTRNDRIKKTQQKPVLQLDMDGNFIKEWGGANEIARETGMAQSAITRCCNGKRNYAYGYKWKYKE